MSNHPLAEYERGQWWHKELECIHGAGGTITAEQYRAINIARKLVDYVLDTHAQKLARCEGRDSRGYPLKPKRWRPLPNSRWLHSATQGIYTVVYVACDANVKEYYAENVVYMNEAQEVFTRTLDDWQTVELGVPRFQHIP